MTRVVSLRSVLELHDTGVWGKDASQDGISVLRSTNFTNDGTITFDNLAIKDVEPKARNAKRLISGDILLERSGGGPKQPVGRVCLFEGDIREHVFGNFIGRLRVDRSQAEPGYLFWFLWHFHRSGGTERYQKQTTGIRNLEFHRYLDLDTPLPPLSEQRRIVDILNRANGIRRLRREALEKARQIVPALFVEMFGDPGRKSKDRPMVPLGKLGSLDRGKSKHRPRNDPILLGGQHPFIQTGDVANSGGRITKCSYTYSDIGLAQSRMWPAGTLCVTIAANIGRTGILNFDACFPDSVVGFTPGDKVTSEYVQAALDYLQAGIEERAPQLAQKNINLKILRALEIPLPDLSLQLAFASRVTDIQAMIVQQQRSAAASERLVNSLMAEVFEFTS